MSNWLVRITAVEAYMGDPRDPLFWHRKVRARTAAEAIAQTRCDPGIPVGAAMVAWPEGQCLQLCERDHI